MNLMTESGEIGFHLPVADTGKIVMGEEVKKIAQSQRVQIGVQVSRQLELNPYTMLQYSPGALIKSMQEGRVILCLDKTSAQLLAFGQIWHYGQNLEGQKVYEFGSWLSFASGGFGKDVLNAAPQLHSQIYPGTQLLAVVESNNVRAQSIIKKSGGVLIGSKLSESIRIQAEIPIPATMIIYDITQKGGD